MGNNTYINQHLLKGTRCQNSGQPVLPLCNKSENILKLQQAMAGK
jgi:hypothetical protein